MSKQRVLVVRHDELRKLCAVVTWHGSVHPLDFRTALTSALLEWVKTTSTGWDAFQDYHQELSLQCLPDWLDIPELKDILKKVGIERLAMTIVDLIEDPANDFFMSDDLLENESIL